MDSAQEQTTTLSEQIQTSQPQISFGAILVASLSISLFIVIGYLLLKWFKL